MSIDIEQNKPTSGPCEILLVIYDDTLREKHDRILVYR